MRAFAFFFLLFASSVSADFREQYREGKFSEALIELDQSPEAAQKNYAYYLNRGLIHHALNQAPLAVAYLSKAKALSKDASEVDAPLADATDGLVKWLGVSRLDSTSYSFETAGDFLPLDALFLGVSLLSILTWFGFFLVARARPFLMRVGFFTLGFAGFFGAWATWNEQHPLVILTESRLVKSGPGETFLDRGSVEPGMKLRIVGVESGSSGSSQGSSERWWKVRFNDRHDIGFIPERSGLLLNDESNTPET